MKRKPVWRDRSLQQSVRCAHGIVVVPRLEHATGDNRDVVARMTREMALDERRVRHDVVIDEQHDVTGSDGHAVVHRRRNRRHVAMDQCDRAAFVVRGELFVASVEHGTTKRITRTATQERSPEWAPDGKSIYFAGERDGSWNLYRVSLGHEAV